MSAPHLFGIRHHGPGSARSLIRAFEALQPDCVLIEGPPEADGLIALAGAPEMAPPVALLTHVVDRPRVAVYHPFAEFSPEWQALRWALASNVPARFIDLPLTHTLAVSATDPESDPESDSGPDSGPDPESDPASDPEPDPLDWLGRAAGFGDGEAWWNHMVEERGDGEELFAAIAEAMTVVRTEVGDRDRTPREARREAQREAYMRQAIRAAQKAGYARIAVVCGAWHIGGLLADVAAKADQALLKGLPKVKVATTWVPWTYRHLTRASGYGAGVHSPGWYEHLWQTRETGTPRAIGWLARIAGLMRARDIDCSPADLIEGARLADALAALRDRPAPGLDELHEAAHTVLTQGDAAVLDFIDDALVVGDRLGSVPPDVPTVPLQRDLDRTQRSLRLKPEALSRTVDLDLRGETDLARSHLLHRLALLEVPWGAVQEVGQSARGTFHEIWTLQWRPELALRVIEASQWGQTIEQAATARVADRCRHATSLAELSSLVDAVLLADLDAAVAAAMHALEARAALTGDAQQLLAALPPLANVFRYGNVRRTDAAMVAHVLDGLIVRGALALPLATVALADDAAEALRGTVLVAHAAVALRNGAEQTAAWRRGLEQVASLAGAHELLQGLAVRLLLDAGTWTGEQAATALSRNLSAGADPGKGAAWLDGFLNRNALVLLHDPAVWQLVDAWLARLGDDHFVRVLPLVRRTVAQFPPAERRELAQRARLGAADAPAPAVEADWDEARAVLPLPFVRELLGLPS